jgi:hypothetical protein
MEWGCAIRLPGCTRLSWDMLGIRICLAFNSIMPKRLTQFVFASRKGSQLAQTIGL